MTDSLLTVRTVAGENPVLLIHGLGSNSRSDWEASGFVDALTSAGRGAILVDLPGHGDGPALARGEVTTGGIAAALAAAVDEHAGGRVDVIGYSLGARLAWALAATGRVNRLVLGGLSPMEPFALVNLDALADAAAGKGAPADPITGMFAGMLGAPGLDPTSVIALIGALAAEPFDATKDVPQVPTLFVSGEGDQMAQGVEQMVAGVPGATLVRVPGDHFGALASPEFRAAAIGFVTES